jgi:hypothetical protein
MKTMFDYAREAELCLEAAEKATSPESRSFLLAMARVWSNLAGEYDRSERSTPGEMKEAPRSAERRAVL